MKKYIFEKRNEKRILKKYWKKEIVRWEGREESGEEGVGDSEIMFGGWR
jgi:hypothetical protein